MKVQLRAPSLQPASQERGLPVEPSSPKVTFRLDIQGLRAVAVVLVILSHAGARHLAGGYVGVDVFYVISGFVITGLLLRSRQGSVGSNLITFYARRFRRILPASTLVLIATVIATYYWLGSYVGRGLITDVRWASLFAVNFHFIDVGTSYFTQSQPPSLILQYWSLAVEEQFYFVLPLLLFSIVAVAAVRRHQTLMLASLGSIVVASSIWCVIQTSHAPVNAYFSPFTRFWELGLGGLVAVLPASWQPTKRGVSGILGWVGLASIAASAVLFTDATAYPGWLAWWPCGGAALLLWVGRSSSPGGPASILSSKPLVYVGAISYSLYLWHFAWINIPLQYATSPMAWTSKVLQILGATVCAVITYHLVENPLRRSTWMDGRRWTAYALGIGLIAVVWAVTAGYLQFAG
jgi:peptidoglycan/LPS O-acetylase OafA/YrhL